MAAAVHGADPTGWAAHGKARAVFPVFPRILPLRFVALAPWALAGVVLWGKGNARHWPLPFALASAICVLVIFAHNSRSRIALVPVLVPYAALACLRTWDWLRGRRWGPAAAVLAAAAALTVWIGRGLPEGQPLVRAADHAVELETFHLPRAGAAAAAGDGERGLVPIYAGIHVRCAELLESAGRGAEAATHRDLARRLQAPGAVNRPAR
jgi:hypothetical protein